MSTPKHHVRDALLRPGRVATIAFVLAVAVACVLLGRWQLARLQERRDANAAILARTHEPTLRIEDVAEAIARGRTSEIEYRTVTITGTWLPADEVLQRNRAFAGQPGFHVVTPLAWAANEAVLVRRGWVPLDDDQPPIEAAAPASGTVTITGMVRLAERPTGFGPQDPEDGRLERVFWIDPARLDAQVAPSLLDVVVDLRDPAAEDPTTQQELAGIDLDELPVPLPSLAFDEANHLSYAVQWFSFALIALVGIAAYARSRWLATDPGP